MTTLNSAPKSDARRSRLRTLVPEPIRPLASRIVAFPRLQMERFVYERPNPDFRRKIVARNDVPEFERLAEQLVRGGCTVVPELYTGDHLSELRDAFEELVRTTPPGHGEDTNAIHISTGRIAESPTFSRIALDPRLRAFAEYSWGKPVVLVGTGGTRIEPLQTEDYGSYQWHHDGKRKQIRAIILLTDLPDNGQRTEYVLGTNKRFRYSVSASRLTAKEAIAQGKTVSLAGPAGSVVFLDTNGIHRGNRNLGPRRDTWNFAYRAPDPYITALTDFPPLHPSVARHLTDEEKRLVRLN